MQYTELLAKKWAARRSSPSGLSVSSGSGKNPAESPQSHFPGTRFGGLAVWATIFGSILFAYLPALHGSLLWDDSSHLTGPDLDSLHGLWRIWFDLGATQQYYPVLHSAFWLEHRMWGDAVSGYHLANLVLHALSACLVVLIVRRLSLPGAWLAGLVFALHPVHVESVAWISEQKSTLSGAFCLASLLVYLHFDQDRRKSRYFLATALFVLALLSKTVTASLPAVILSILWWRRGRLEGKRDVVPLLPWFALGISAGLFTAWVESTIIGARGPDFLLTPAQRVLIAGRAICFYAGKLLWPADLAFFYPHWKIDPAAWWQWLFPAAVLALGAVLWRAARRYRGPLTSFLIFSGTLFPVLGFLNVYPFRYSYVADHFQYLASLGIIVPVMALLAGTIERTSWRKAAIACPVILVLILGVLSWRQSRAYRDLETLYRHSLAHNPASWMAHYNLGALLSEMPGRFPEAIAEYQAALRIKPDCTEALNNLGIALSHTPERIPEAIAYYQAALRIKPDFAEAHNNLGRALSRTPGRTPDAITEYQAAFRIRPDYAEAHYNLGNLLSRTPGRLQDAIAEYQAAVQIRPGFAAAHYNLGILLAAMPGRLSDAIAEYRAALRVSPDLAEAHNNLGILLSRIPGKLPEAIEEYQAALRIRPDYAEAHTNLGNALSQVPDRLPEAIAEYQAALQINPDYAEAHIDLGSALSRTPGRLLDAVAECRAALRIRPDYAEAHLSLAEALSQIPGRSAEAIAEYRAAVRIRPGFASLVNERVQALHASGPRSGNSGR